VERAPVKLTLDSAERLRTHYRKRQAAKNARGPKD
jgi:hypothetical protein